MQLRKTPHRTRVLAAPRRRPQRLAAWLAAAGLALGSLVPGTAAAQATGLGPEVTAVTPDYGPLVGGTTVTISGINLEGATAVLFGSTPAAAFTDQSATSITAVAPAAPPVPGTVPVTVLTPEGTSPATPQATFTYVGVPTVSAVVPASGPPAGGSTVTILGSGFSGASAVDFGSGRGAAFRVISDTEITATVPADTVQQLASRCVRGHCVEITQAVPATVASTVDVSVTTPEGTSTTSPADQFTYLPVPTVTAVSPPSGPSAGGTAVSISGSGFTGATSVTFGDTPAAFSVVSDQTITATTPPGTGTVAVTVSKQPRVVAIAAGAHTAYAIDSAGTLWAWGLRAPARAGESPLQALCGCTDVPVQMTGLAHLVAVAVGSGTTYALEGNGTVWAWGDGLEGQLGDGQLADSATPVQVSGLSNVRAIAAGTDAAFALEANGTVWAWGSDIFGELGSRAAWRNPCLCADRPVQVKGLPPITAIAAGGETVYALANGGSVWAWGGGFAGQLGNGSQRAIGAPAAVSGLQDVVQIAAGGESAYAVEADGSVWAWGADDAGQLGTGAAAAVAGSGCGCVPTPVRVAGLPAVTAIAAAGSTAYAIAADGDAWAWGQGADGQAGSAGSLGPNPTPALLPFWADANPASAAATFTYVPPASAS